MACRTKLKGGLYAGIWYSVNPCTVCAEANSLRLGKLTQWPKYFLGGIAIVQVTLGTFIAHLLFRLSGRQNVSKQYDSFTQKVVYKCQAAQL